MSQTACLFFLWVQLRASSDVVPFGIASLCYLPVFDQPLKLLHPIFWCVWRLIQYCCLGLIILTVIFTFSLFKRVNWALVQVSLFCWSRSEKELFFSFFFYSFPSFLKLKYTCKLVPSRSYSITYQISFHEVTSFRSLENFGRF